jgi:hypothetical protein
MYTTEINGLVATLSGESPAWYTDASAKRLNVVSISGGKTSFQNIIFGFCRYKI